MHTLCTVNGHGLGVCREGRGISTFPHPTSHLQGPGRAGRANTQLSNSGVEFCCAQITGTVTVFFPKNTGTGGILKILYRCHSAHISYRHLGTSGTHPRVRVTHPCHAWTFISTGTTHLHNQLHINALPHHSKRSSFKNSTPLMHYPITQKKKKNKL